MRGKLRAGSAVYDFEDAERRTSDWVAGPWMVQRGDSGQDVRWSRPTKRGEVKEARRVIRQEWAADRARGFPEPWQLTFVLKLALKTPELLTLCCTQRNFAGYCHAATFAIKQVEGSTVGFDDFAAKR